jgi:hypothetical protein
MQEKEKKLSERQKELLREFCGFCCEGCHKHENEVGTLQFHRIKRGGLYELRNIKLLCKKCHKLYHSKEQF